MDDELIPQKFQRGFHRKEPIEDQQRQLAQAQTIFDVGANTGQSVRQYRKYFPDAHIYAFEPFHDAFAELSASFAKDIGVTCINKSVSAAPGRQKFHVYETSVTNSLMPFIPGAQKYVPFSTELKKTVEVDVTCLDSYCQANAINHIDILKLDTQGAELDIIAGASDLLKRGAISLIFVELLFVQLYEGQADFHEVLSKLSMAGYRIFDFYDFVYAPDGQLKYGDALFIGPHANTAP